MSKFISIPLDEYRRLLRAEAREREHQVAFSLLLAKLNVLAGYLRGSVGEWNEPQARQAMYTHASEMSGQVDRFMAKRIEDEEVSGDEFVPR